MSDLPRIRLTTSLSSVLGNCSACGGMLASNVKGLHPVLRVELGNTSFCLCQVCRDFLSERLKNPGAAPGLYLAEPPKTDVKSHDMIHPSMYQDFEHDPNKARGPGLDEAGMLTGAEPMSIRDQCLANMAKPDPEWEQKEVQMLVQAAEDDKALKSSKAAADVLVKEIVKEVTVKVGPNAIPVVDMAAPKLAPYMCVCGRGRVNCMGVVGTQNIFYFGSCEGCDRQVEFTTDLQGNVLPFEHKINEAPQPGCNCRMCEAARAAKQ